MRGHAGARAADVSSLLLELSGVVVALAERPGEVGHPWVPPSSLARVGFHRVHPSARTRGICWAVPAGQVGHYWTRILGKLEVHIVAPFGAR